MGNPAAAALDTQAVDIKPAERRASPRAECVIDLVHLSRQTLGDPALETELLALFSRQAGLALTQLGSGVSPSRPDIANLAHKLCGSARAIGAADVAAAAARLESAAASGATDLVDARKVLAAALQTARKAIGDLLSEG